MKGADTLSLRIGLEKRMAIHVAALCQRSLSYDEFTRQALEQERTAQQTATTCGSTQQQLSSTENRGPLPVPPPQSTGMKLGTTVSKGNQARRHAISGHYRTKTEGKSKKKDVRTRLAEVCNAWDDFQECRDRDAVYDYLRAVFSIVRHYSGRERTKRLMRCAFKFAGLPMDMDADPFAVVIRCTCDGEADNKTISKWSRALQYVARVKKPRHPLTTFMKNRGGINACAERYAKHFGGGER
jgi:hypothetical protein